MKTLVFALVAFASLAASAQDTTGCEISADKKYATCLVDALGEGANESRYVTFKIRGDSAPVAPGTGCYSEAGAEVACPNGKVPQWLKDLNTAFDKAGFSAPVDEQLTNRGG